MHMDDKDKDIPLVELDKNGVPKQRRRGKAKPKKITTAPTLSEWQELGRESFTAIRELITHRDPETDLPTAPVSLYSTIATIMKTIDTTAEVPKEDSNSAVNDKLKELRHKRKLTHRDDYITDDEIEKVRRSQVETGAINVDEPATLPVIPWSQANTLDED